MAEVNSSITGIVLAGGQSSRFKTNKALAEWKDGKSLIEKVLCILKPVFSLNLVLVKEPGKYQFLKDDNVKIVADVLPACHSLGGIYSGLVSSPTGQAFICGCDMPFINPGLIKGLVNKAVDYDAVIPFFQEKPQTLCGVYSKKCIPEIETMIKAGHLRIKDLLNRVNTCYFDEAEIRLLDPEGRSFLDVDTLEDYRFIKGMTLEHERNF